MEITDNHQRSLFCMASNGQTKEKKDKKGSEKNKTMIEPEDSEKGIQGLFWSRKKIVC